MSMYRLRKKLEKEKLEKEIILPTPKYKLISIAVSVNYSDYLAECLPYNSKIIDKVIIVTDPRDKGTIECCKPYNNVEVLLSDRLNVNGLEFNKSALINHALDVYGFDSEWILITDADTRIISGDFRPQLDSLQKHVLYGLSRKIYTTKYNFDHGIFEMGNLVSVGYGYFQLFNTSSEVWVKKRPRYYEGRSDKRTASNFRNCDTIFARNWRPIPRLANVEVEHLGIYRINWGGRKTPKWNETENIKEYTENVVPRYGGREIIPG